MPQASWSIVPADEKRRARLNLICHIPDQIPYRKVDVDLPKIPKPKPRSKGMETALGANPSSPTGIERNGRSAGRIRNHR
jgi:hypothetical protein